jgi:plastocyanin
MKIRCAVIFAIAIAIAIAAPAMAADAGHTVIQQGRRFKPAEITIRAGESLTVTNDDEFIHQIYSDGLFDSDEKVPGQAVVQNFPRSGTFEVRCHIHPKMKLVVHVQ